MLREVYHVKIRIVPKPFDTKPFAISHQVSGTLDRPNGPPRDQRCSVYRRPHLEGLPLTRRPERPGIMRQLDIERPRSPRALFGEKATPRVLDELCFRTFHLTCAGAALRRNSYRSKSKS